MTDATLIADLVRAGLDPDLVGRVAAAIASADVCRPSADSSADARRERDRKYQKTQRLLRKTEKQTMLGSQQSSADASADESGERCESSSFLSSTSEEQRRTENKKEEPASKRGTRMQAGATISVEGWEFARDAGFNDMQIKTMWAEYVDYWTGIPGQRGSKTNWPGTWRNRVRALSTGKRVNGHGTKSSTMGSAFDELDSRLDSGNGNAGRDRPPILDL